MNPPPARDLSKPPAVPGTGAATGASSGRIGWLLFGPPALMVVVRGLLELLSDRENAIAALALSPVSTTSGSMELLWAIVALLAVLLTGGLLLRRMGWRRVMPALGAVWLLLWLAGSAALVQRHLNRQGLFLHGMTLSAATDSARVVTSQLKPASLRSLGGTELVLQVKSLEIPQRLLINDAKASALKPGDVLALKLASGRFGGLFVTGWQVAPAVVSP